MKINYMVWRFIFYIKEGEFLLIIIENGFAKACFYLNLRASFFDYLALQYKADLCLSSNRAARFGLGAA